MPSTLPLQCLSCKYLNLSDAIFCTVCSKKLGARPCQQCGAIDDLAAKNCRKCGASFTQPLQPEHQASCASAINVTGLAASTLINTRPAETPPTRLVRGKADAPPEFKRAVQKSSTATDLNITRSRQRWLAAIAMLLVVLAIDIFSVYFYYAEPEQLAKAEIEKTTVALQASPEQRVEPKPDGLNPSSALLPVQVVLTPKAVEEPLRLKECPQAVATLGLCNVPVNE